jgi:hypothetical protein
MRVILGRYELAVPVASGGMGTLWEGTDRRLNRKIVTKLIRPGKRRDADAMRRFNRDARITARLGHPSVPILYDSSSQEYGRPSLPRSRRRRVPARPAVRRRGSAAVPGGWPSPGRQRRTRRMVRERRPAGAAPRSPAPGDGVAGNAVASSALIWPMSKRAVRKAPVSTSLPEVRPNSATASAWPGWAGSAAAVISSRAHTPPQSSAGPSRGPSVQTARGIDGRTTPQSVNFDVWPVMR